MLCTVPYTGIMGNYKPFTLRDFLPIYLMAQTNSLNVTTQFPTSSERQIIPVQWCLDSGIV